MGCVCFMEIRTSFREHEHTDAYKPVKIRTETSGFRLTGLRV